MPQRWGKMGGIKMIKNNQNGNNQGIEWDDKGVDGNASKRGMSATHMYGVKHREKHLPWR